MRRHPRRLGWVLLSVALGCASGCASFPDGDRELAAGAYREAAAAYEAQLHRRPGGEREAHALYSLAIIYATPRSPLHDPSRAQDLFKKLIGRFPESPLSRSAELYLLFEKRVLSLEASLESRQTALGRLADWLDETTTSAAAESRRQEEESAQQSTELERLRERLRSRETELRRRDALVRELERQLAELKKIDMEIPP